MDGSVCTKGKTTGLTSISGLSGIGTSRTQYHGTRTTGSTCYVPGTGVQVPGIPVQKYCDTVSCSKSVVVCRMHISYTMLLVPCSI